MLALFNVLFPPGTILDCFLVQHRVGVIALREITFIHEYDNGVTDPLRNLHGHHSVLSPISNVIFYELLV